MIKQAFFLLILLFDKIFPRNGMPVLFFHSMDESGSPLSISRNKFLKFAGHLHKRGYHKSVLITFDDGYKNNIAAIQALRQFNFKIVVFVATGFIGKKNTFCRKDFPRLEMMSRDDISELSRQGVKFGAHGHTHRNLPELSPKELTFEIKESKRIIETAIGKNIDYFCYPRGKFNDRVINALKNNGFKMAFTSKTGIISHYSPPFLLPRVPLNDAVSMLQFRALLSPWYATFRNIIR